jgi:prepilin peptidase CpaA
VQGKKESVVMNSFAWWPTLIVLAVATFTDLRNRRIPNWLVLPFMLAGIAVSGWLHGWHGIGQSFAGLGLGVLIYGFLFWLGGMGAGDVKLCAAIGAWIGPNQLFIALVITAMAGGIMVLCWAAFGGFLKDLFTGAGSVVFGWKERGMHRDPELVLSNPLKRKMPYAPAIAIGTLISFFSR